MGNYMWHYHVLAGGNQAVRVFVENGWVDEGMFDGVPEGVYTANVVYREVLQH
jgi:hypothetical protein